MSQVVIPAIGCLVAGGVFFVIGSLLVRHFGHLARVGIWGRISTGRVVALERSGGRVRARVRFRAADGREIEYVEPIAVKSNVGETRDVRYSLKNPTRATTCPRVRLIAETVFPIVLFGIGGMAVFLSSLWALLADNRQVFYGISGSIFFLLIACILLYVSGRSVAQTAGWHRMVPAQGVVARVEPQSGGRSEYLHPYITYTAIDGRKIEYHDMRLAGYGPGEEVDVFYDPRYPEFTSTGIDRSGHLAQSIFFGVVGLAFLVVGFGLAWSQFFRT